MIGPPLREAIAMMLPSISERDAEKVIKDFKSFYDNGLCLEYTLHPKAVHFIKSSSCSDRFFIVTNKRDVPAQLIFSSDPFFDLFERRITIDTKGYIGLTKGERIVKLMKEKSLLNIECVYIGDHPHDEIAAHYATIDFKKAW
jgi:FMN phosphatase YigB (HAD superfamily)